MTTVSVSIDTSGAHAALHQMVLAGLPNSYRRVEADADVVFVSAPDPAGLERRCSSNIRVVVIDQPGLLAPGDLAAIAALAERRGFLVVPAPRYAPRLAAVGNLLDDCNVDILETTILSSGSPRSSLVEQLALLRTLLGAAVSIRPLQISASHYSFAAEMVDHPQSNVILNGVASPTGTEEVTLHSVGADRRVVVRIDADPVARPAEIYCYGPDGTHSPWPVHQHAHRLTLVQLHDALSSGSGYAGYSFEDLRHDVQLADAFW